MFSYTIKAQALITSLKEIRYWTSPDYTRVVFDLDRPLLFKEIDPKDPFEIKAEFKNCKNGLKEKQLQIKSSLIQSLQLEKGHPQSVIVKVKLTGAYEYTIFYLKKYNGKPDRIVIDVKNPLSANENQKTTESIRRLKDNNWIVVLDPGHGGEDPGAIGKNGFAEKDIVLSVGKKLSQRLNKQKGLKAYLTRDGDYFLSLRDRIEIAHKYHADLFVSLHANSCRRKSKKGASVFYLSQDGASDEFAALLAEKENASDKIGGIPLGKDKVLDSILIDLAQTHTINESINLGEKVLKYLTKIKSLSEEGLKCANFGVLKSPSIPSILVELAYISNSSDLRLLISENSQDEMASMIVNGITKYLASHPPKDKQILKQVRQLTSSLQIPKQKIYVVKKGDTLWRIASVYSIPLDILREINGLNSFSKIIIGQKLQIPLP